MYIARRELRIPDGSGKLKLVQIGETVEGVETWDEVARRAILNLEWIEKVDDAPTPAIPATVEKKSKKKESASK